MNSNDPLNALKPLIAPPAISWWPPAPGWWILGALLLCIVILTAIFGWKRWRHHQNTAYQREALQLIALLSTFPAPQRLAMLAAILRRAAISVWGRELAGTCDWQTLATLSANEWSKRHRHKKASLAFNEHSLQLLTTALYRNTTPVETEIQTLETQARAWLQSLPPVEH